jgi:hypothetical protein
VVAAARAVELLPIPVAAGSAVHETRGVETVARHTAYDDMTNFTKRTIGDNNVLGRSLLSKIKGVFGFGSKSPSPPPPPPPPPRLPLQAANDNAIALAARAADPEACESKPIIGIHLIMEPYCQ